MKAYRAREGQCKVTRNSLKLALVGFIHFRIEQKRLNMKKILGSLVVLSALGALSNPAYAACPLPEGKKVADLSQEELNAHYECSRDELVKSYQSKDNEIAAQYTGWKAVATGPAKPGVHSNRYLMTYVNEIGYADYVEYKTGFDFPIGTVAAKESYKIKNNGKLKKGPLLIMEKVGKEQAPKTGGWIYKGVKANGATMKVSQKFCHNCHQAYAFQDFLGYPVAGVRLTK